MLAIDRRYNIDCRICSETIGFTVTNTEGLTATCAEAFGLPNLTNFNWRPKNSTELANNKV